MKFSAREDIEAPIDAVFEMVTDFAAFEERAMRHGAEVRRSDDLTQPGVGMAWAAQFDLREKRRDVVLTVTEFEPPTRIEAEAASEGLGATIVVTLVARSTSRTEVAVTAEVKPKTLASRLLIQSMKLAKGRLDQGFKERVASYASAMEERYQRPV